MSLNLLVSPKLFLEAPSRLPSPQNFEFESGALSNLVIRNAFPIGLYSLYSELCFFFIYMKIWEILIGLQVLVLFYTCEKVWKITEKHNFVRLRKENFSNG